MRLFKHFFHQFSYKSSLVTIFQVSLRLVEGLQKKRGRKSDGKGQIAFINRILYESPDITY